MSDDRPVPPSGADPTQPVPQAGQTRPIPPGGWSQSPPPPAPGPVPPGGQGSGGYQQPGGHQQPGPPQDWRNPTYSDYRPGTIPLRPLTMSDIFGGVVATIRGNLAATLGLGLLVTAIAVIPATAIGIWWARSGSFDLEGLDPGQSDELATALGSALPNLAQGLVVLVTAAFMVWVIGQGAIGRRVGPAQVWAGTRRRLLPLLGTVVLTVLLFLAPFIVFLIVFIALVASSDSGAVVGLFGFFGFFAIFVWFVLAWVRTAFATSATVLEEAGPLTAIKRSWALTRGQFWRIFGIRFLTAIVIGIVSTVISLPITRIADQVLTSAGATSGDLITWGVFASAFATVLAGILTTPFSAGVDALLYVDQRMRKEGLDVALMRAAQGQDG